MIDENQNSQPQAANSMYDFDDTCSLGRENGY